MKVQQNVLLDLAVANLPNLKAHAPKLTGLCASIESMVNITYQEQVDKALCHT